MKEPDSHDIMPASRKQAAENNTGKTSRASPVVFPHPFIAYKTEDPSDEEEALSQEAPQKNEKTDEESASENLNEKTLSGRFCDFAGQATRKETYDHLNAHLRWHFLDRQYLQVSAAALALSDFMREDTKKHPWRYPFYAAYMLTWISPYPPMISTTLTIATLAFAATNLGPYAKRLNKSLSGAFNQEALVEKYKDHLDPHHNHPELMKLKWWSLSKYMTVKMTDDTKEATRYAWDEAERVGGVVHDKIRDFTKNLFP